VLKTLDKMSAAVADPRVTDECDKMSETMLHYCEDTTHRCKGIPGRTIKSSTKSGEKRAGQGVYLRGDPRFPLCSLVAETSLGSNHTPFFLILGKGLW
jgi:hypothetical protein